jgi:hypothetical protein
MTPHNKRPNLDNPTTFTNYFFSVALCAFFFFKRCRGRSIEIEIESVTVIEIEIEIEVVTVIVVVMAPFYFILAVVQAASRWRAVMFWP